MRFAVVAIVALAVTATAFGATRPYQWTPAQAKAAIMQHAEEVYVEPTRKLPKDLLTLACRGTSRKVAGRFTAFRCAATFEGTTLQDPPNRAIIKARTRRAGGLCWTTATTVPTGCLKAGRRARGSVSDAYRAVVVKFGTPGGGAYCLAHGSGFYSCGWTSGGAERRATVTFAPRPVVRVLS